MACVLLLACEKWRVLATRRVYLCFTNKLSVLRNGSCCPEQGFINTWGFELTSLKVKQKRVISSAMLLRLQNLTEHSQNLWPTCVCLQTYKELYTDAFSKCFNIYMQMALVVSSRFSQKCWSFGHSICACHDTIRSCSDTSYTNRTQFSTCILQLILPALAFSFVFQETSGWHFLFSYPSLLQQEEHWTSSVISINTITVFKLHYIIKACWTSTWRTVVHTCRIAGVNAALVRYYQKEHDEYWLDSGKEGKNDIKFLVWREHGATSGGLHLSMILPKDASETCSIIAYTLSHPENDRDVTGRAKGNTLLDASFMHQSQNSFLNVWDNM